MKKTGAKSLRTSTNERMPSPSPHAMYAERRRESLVSVAPAGPLMTPVLPGRCRPSPRTPREPSASCQTATHRHRCRRPRAVSQPPRTLVGDREYATSSQRSRTTPPSESKAVSNVRGQPPPVRRSKSPTARRSSRASLRVDPTVVTSRSQASFDQGRSPPAKPPDQGRGIELACSVY